MKFVFCKFSTRFNQNIKWNTQKKPTWQLCSYQQWIWTKRCLPRTPPFQREGFWRQLDIFGKPVVFFTSHLWWQYCTIIKELCLFQCSMDTKHIWIDNKLCHCTTHLTTAVLRSERYSEEGERAGGYMIYTALK
jgi:hypothetical protein